MQSFESLEIFVRVVEKGSFSAAARALDLTPSAVSKQINRLENGLGARLFNRTTRSLRLTEVGTAFHERVRRILGDLAEAEEAVANLGGEARGLLRLNVPNAFALHHIAPLIPAYLAAHPQVRVDMLLNDRYVDMIEEGYDVSIRVGELADSSLIARKLAENRRVACAAPAYLANCGPLREPSDLTAHNCLVYTYRASRNDWRFIGPDGEEQVVRVSGNLETNSAEALKSGVLDGLGIGLLPLWLVGEDLRDGRLVEIMPDFHTPDSAIYALYAPGRHLSPKVRSFVDFLAEQFRDRDDWICQKSRKPAVAAVGS